MAGSDALKESSSPMHTEEAPPLPPLKGIQGFWRLYEGHVRRAIVLYIIYSPFPALDFPQIGFVFAGLQKGEILLIWDHLDSFGEKHLF